MKKLFILPIVIFSMLAAGCPSDSQYKKLAKATSAIAEGSRELTRQIDKAYDAGSISLEEKDRYAGYLRRIIKGDQAAVSLLGSLPREGAWPKDQAGVAAKLLSEEIVTPFLELTAAISGKDVPDYVRAAVSALRAAILIVTETAQEIGVDALPIVSRLDGVRKSLGFYRGFRREVRYAYV